MKWIKSPPELVAVATLIALIASQLSLEGSGESIRLRWNQSRWVHGAR